jgi:hypothetical protein
MSKGKHNNKRDRAQHRAQQQVNKILPQDAKIVAAKKEPESSETPDPDSYNKEKYPMGFSQFVKRSSFTDWLLAAFTCVLAVAAIIQFIVTDHQLNVMRNDQRAWLEFGAQSGTSEGGGPDWHITSGQPITYPIRIANVGKTPAKHMVVKVFVDVIDSSQDPPLDRVGTAKTGSAFPFALVEAGVVFPNGDFSQSVMRVVRGGAPLVATLDEARALRDGRAYLAVYGIITYDDVFNAPHWTKFCHWVAGDGSFHARGCTEYNGVDDE